MNPHPWIRASMIRQSQIRARVEALRRRREQDRARRRAVIERAGGLVWMLASSRSASIPQKQIVEPTPAKASAHVPASSASVTPTGLPVWLLSTLRCFRWLCDEENRSNIDLAISDLLRDSREMREEGRSRFLVAAVLSWRAAGVIVPIIWDGALQVLKAILPLFKILIRWAFFERDP